MLFGFQMELYIYIYMIPFGLLLMQVNYYDEYSNFLQTYWTVYSPHKNPEYFSDPEKFDPSRFEGQGPPPYAFVPFGGGHHMCLGKEYARVEIRVFIYNVVTRFKLEIVNPNENITHNLEPIPKNGLPIRFQPHQM